MVGAGYSFVQVAVQIAIVFAQPAERNDAAPAASFAVVAVSFALLAALTLRLLQSGYKLRT